MARHHWTVVLAALLLAPGVGRAAEAASEPSLAELLDSEVSVATKMTMSARESPAIVTVISRQEILDAGARDLTDALLLVPGIQLGTDKFGITSLGMRGMFGESKILLLVDGHEFNDAMFNAVVLGNTFPIDQVKKIEVIRGPGSAMYGGYAELAVINVVLMNAYDLDGVAGSATFGQLDGKGYARANGSLSYGKKVGDLKLAAGLFGGLGQQATGTYTDPFGSSYQLGGSSARNPLNAHLDLEYKGASLNVMVDWYRMTQRDRFEYIQPAATDLQFRTYLASLQYELKVGDDLATVTPRIALKWQTPWRDIQDATDFTVSHGYGTVDISFQRTTLSLTARSEKVPHLNLMGGVEYWTENAQATDDTMPSYWFQGGPGKGKVALKTEYAQMSLFAQAIADLNFVNLTLGGRYDYHSQYGRSFTPRLALTKVIGDFHFKALAAQAYASPSIFDLEYTPTIRPETTTTFEVEAGYLIASGLSLSANVFDTTLKNQISHFIDVTNGVDGFRNAGTTRSRGAEVELRFKRSNVYLNMNYAYYRAIESSPDYAVPGLNPYFLAYSPHKLTLQGSARVLPSLSISPSVVVLGPRYAFDRYDATAWDDPFRTPLMKHYSPTYLVNLVATYHDLFVPGVNVTAGVYNILGQDYRNLLPAGGFVHPGMPAMQREFGIRLAYEQGGGGAQAATP